MKGDESEIGRTINYWSFRRSYQRDEEKKSEIFEKGVK